jgi:hypothetical protein
MLCAFLAHSISGEHVAGVARLTECSGSEDPPWMDLPSCLSAVGFDLVRLVLTSSKADIFCVIFVYTHFNVSVTSRLHTLGLTLGFLIICLRHTLGKDKTNVHARDPVHVC